MFKKQFPGILVSVVIGTLVSMTANAKAADPLPSWNDGKAKQSIIDFVEKVTQPD